MCLSLLWGLETLPVCSMSRDVPTSSLYLGEIGGPLKSKNQSSPTMAWSCRGTPSGSVIGSGFDMCPDPLFAEVLTCLDYDLVLPVLEGPLLVEQELGKKL